jgi:glycosyltransferase involved in cell wall biosynthesis
VNTPQVTVCIPVCNGERHLAYAIESVLSQTFNDLELVILNNASTDGTAQVIARYHDPRIRVIEHRTNIGFLANWNCALTEARGTYCKMLPHDDTLYPTCLEQQVAAFVAQPDLALVSCARHITDDAGAIVATRRFSHALQVLSGAAAQRAIIRSGTNPLGEPGAVLFRRALAEVCGPFNGAHVFVIDVEYYCRLLQHGGLCALPEPLCTFRVSNGSTSVRMMHRQAREFISFAHALARTSPTMISRLDCARATCMASLNNVLRMLFYAYLATRCRWHVASNSAGGV